MKKPKITTTIVTSEKEQYEWKCPECGKSVVKSGWKPNSHESFLCWECRAKYEEEVEKKDFDIWAKNENILGATLIGGRRIGYNDEKDFIFKTEGGQIMVLEVRLHDFGSDGSFLDMEVVGG